MRFAGKTLILTVWMHIGTKKLKSSMFKRISNLFLHKQKVSFRYFIATTFQNISRCICCNGRPIWILQCHKNKVSSDVYLINAMVSVHGDGNVSLFKVEQWKNLPSEIIYIGWNSEHVWSVCLLVYVPSQSSFVR